MTTKSKTHEPEFRSFDAFLAFFFPKQRNETKTKPGQTPKEKGIQMAQDSLRVLSSSKSHHHNGNHKNA